MALAPGAPPAIAAPPETLAGSFARRLGGLRNAAGRFGAAAIQSGRAGLIQGAAGLQTGAAGLQTALGTGAERLQTGLSYGSAGLERGLQALQAGTAGQPFFRGEGTLLIAGEEVYIDSSTEISGLVYLSKHYLPASNSAETAEFIRVMNLFTTSPKDLNEGACELIEKGIRYRYTTVKGELFEQADRMGDRSVVREKLAHVMKLRGLLQELEKCGQAPAAIGVKGKVPDTVPLVEAELTEERAKDLIKKFAKLLLLKQTKGVSAGMNVGKLISQVNAISVDTSLADDNKNTIVAHVAKNDLQPVLAKLDSFLKSHEGFESKKDGPPEEKLDAIIAKLTALVEKKDPAAMDKGTLQEEVEKGLRLRTQLRGFIAAAKAELAGDDAADAAVAALQAALTAAKDEATAARDAAAEAARQADAARLGLAAAEAAAAAAERARRELLERLGALGAAGAGAGAGAAGAGAAGAGAADPALIAELRSQLARANEQVAQTRGELDGTRQAAAAAAAASAAATAAAVAQEREAAAAAAATAAAAREAAVAESTAARQAAADAAVAVAAANERVTAATGQQARLQAERDAQAARAEAAVAAARQETAEEVTRLRVSEAAIQDRLTTAEAARAAAAAQVAAQQALVDQLQRDRGSAEQRANAADELVRSSRETAAQELNAIRERARADVIAEQARVVEANGRVEQANLRLATAERDLAALRERLVGAAPAGAHDDLAAAVAAASAAATAATTAIAERAAAQLNQRIVELQGQLATETARLEGERRLVAAEQQRAQLAREREVAAEAALAHIQGQERGVTQTVTIGGLAQGPVQGEDADLARLRAEAAAARDAAAATVASANRAAAVAAEAARSAEREIERLHALLLKLTNPDEDGAGGAGGSSSPGGASGSENDTFFQLLVLLSQMQTISDVSGVQDPEKKRLLLWIQGLLKRVRDQGQVQAQGPERKCILKQPLNNLGTNRPNTVDSIKITTKMASFYSEPPFCFYDQRDTKLATDNFYRYSYIKGKPLSEVTSEIESQGTAPFSYHIEYVLNDLFKRGWLGELPTEVNPDGIIIKNSVKNPSTGVFYDTFKLHPSLTPGFTAKLVSRIIPGFEPNISLEKPVKLTVSSSSDPYFAQILHLWKITPVIDGSPTTDKKGMVYDYTQDPLYHTVKTVSRTEKTIVKLHTELAQFFDFPAFGSMSAPAVVASPPVGTVQQPPAAAAAAAVARSPPPAQGAAAPAQGAAAPAPRGGLGSLVLAPPPQANEVREIVGNVAPPSQSRPASQPPQTPRQEPQSLPGSVPQAHIKSEIKRPVVSVAEQTAIRQMTPQAWKAARRAFLIQQYNDLALVTTQTCRDEKSRIFKQYNPMGQAYIKTPTLNPEELAFKSAGVYGNPISDECLPRRGGKRTKTRKLKKRSKKITQKRR